MPWLVSWKRLRAKCGRQVSDEGYGGQAHEWGCLCRYIPFSGGPRKCVGDQFALMEAVIALAVLVKRFDFRMVPDQDIGMTTGATIHTQNGLFMTVKERQQQGAQSVAALEPAAANVRS